MKGKVLRASPDAIYQMVDAFMQGLSDGWVFVGANARGRKCTEAVFPDNSIKWRDPGDGWPADFRGFSFNLPDLESTTRHRLRDIWGDTWLDDATPDALAFVLAMAAKHQGARVALVKGDGKLEIFLPAEN
jgi:hypothetical protein